MTTQINRNGQRKQLSDQLDRLDGLIDSLSDGLNQAVAGAVEAAVGQAVKQAVEGALTELLQHPAVRDLLRKAAAPQPAADDKKTGGPLGAAWRWTCAKVRDAAGACAAGLRACGNAVQRSGAATWSAVLTGGALVAAGACLARSKLTAAACAVGGWACRLVSAGGAALRRLAPAFGPCPV